MAPNRRRNINCILTVASLLVIVVAAIVTAGCTAGTSTPGAVVGPSWTLDSYLAGNGTLVGVLPGTEISARFDDDGKVTGSAGCNGYGGDYNLNGTTLTVSSLVQTLKLCTEPAGIMEQENTYLNLLPSVSSYRVEGNHLVLSDTTGADLLFFVQAPLDEAR